MKPAISWGGAISWVKEQEFQFWGLPDKFEPGTPNLSGAVSLLKAFKYIENIGWYEKIVEIEDELTEYTLEKFKNLESIELIGSAQSKNRIGVFSFVVKWIHSHDIADYMAENNICIRSWQHCAEPLMGHFDLHNTCRISLYIYNDTKDIDDFFNVLEKCILELK
jgi:cysteine desulfurase/selenocysteine lyase